MKQNLVNSLTETQGFEERLKNESNYSFDIILSFLFFIFDIYIYIQALMAKKEEEPKTATATY